MKGSNSYKSEGSDKRLLMKNAKDKAMSTFTANWSEPLKCVVCGKDDKDTQITLAHIVSSAIGDYDAFGTKNGYISDFDVFSVRNFMPLCGTHGERGTCHDAMDNHHIYIVYNAFDRTYHIQCAMKAPAHFHEMRGKKLTTPPGWNPYHRLLAWRSRKSGTEHGFVPDFAQFEAMNKISEDSKSRGNVENSLEEGDGDVTESIDVTISSEIDSSGKK